MNGYLFTGILNGSEVEKGVNSTIRDMLKDVGKFFEFFDSNMIGKILTKIIIALVVYFIGRKLVKLVAKLVKRSLEKSSMEESVTKFLINLTSIGLNAVLLVSIVGILGVPTSSFVALIGSAGLAVGLSLQGSLANFAGGVLILILKPFRVNDFIISNDVEGKVTDIDIFYTKLMTADNQKIVIPNGILANSSIRNVPDEDYRRLDLIIPVDYNSDIKKVRSVLRNIASKDNRVIQDKGVEVLVDTLADSAINISFRIWVATANFFPVKFDLQEMIIEKFREEDINIPFNQLDVTIKQ